MVAEGQARRGSLSATLLARKGEARPAMRPRTIAADCVRDGEDDLGWNDMGADMSPSELPPVLLQREALGAELGAPILRDGPSARRSAKSHAAFTLRLSPERQSRLHLAAKLHGVSAQVFVTRALDQFLQSMSEVEALPSQLPPRAKRSSVRNVR